MVGIQYSIGFWTIIYPKERDPRRDEWELEKVNV
jgi:hypothetical protein